MNHISKCLLSSIRKRTFQRCTFYTGPESFPDYTGSIRQDNTRTSKKTKDMYLRIKDLHEGKTFEDAKDKIVDAGEKKIFELDHTIYTNNPQKYHVEVKDKYFYDDSIIGNSVEAEESCSIGTMDPDFIMPEIQSLLYELIEREVNKVHAYKPGHLSSMPRVRLLTDEQLRKEIARKDDEAKMMMKVPPVMLERSEIEEVIAHDHQLDGYEDAKLVFTDISEDLPKNERMVVVRETDGLLRKARWGERDRMMQIYYPSPYRTMNKPRWVHDMSVPLNQNLHLNMLEQIYGEYEPDSVEYVQLTRKVYDHIDHNCLYHLIRSTRFYGSFVFYLAKHSNLDELLKYMINENLISHAAGLVKLFTLIKHDSATAKWQSTTKSEDDLDLINAYVDNDAVNRQALIICIETLKMNDQKQKITQSN